MSCRLHSFFSPVLPQMFRASWNTVARSPHHAMGAGDSRKCLAECLAHSASLLYFGISVCFVFQDKAVAPLSKTPTNQSCQVEIIVNVLCRSLLSGTESSLLLNSKSHSSTWLIWCLKFWSNRGSESSTWVSPSPLTNGHSSQSPR